MSQHDLRSKGTGEERRSLLRRVLRKSQIVEQAAPVQPRDPQLLDLPLSRSQEAVWFMEHLSPDSGGLNLPSAVRIHGPLDLDLLRRCLDELMQRHEILRTVFPARAGQPVQRVLPDLTVELHQDDCSEFPEEDRLDQATAVAAGRTRVPFDLGAGPAWRISICRLGPEDHLLSLIFHHILWDGWSVGVFTGELAALYDAFQQGLPSPLPAPSLQFGDFAVWERDWLAGDDLQARLAWWRESLAGIEDLELPLDRPHPAVPSFPGATVPVSFPLELVEALDKLRLASSATLFATLFTAFAALLGRLSDQRRFAVGTPMANRVHGDLGGVIGPLANILVLPVDLAGAPTFRELLGRAVEITREAFARQDVPYELIVEHLGDERTPGRNPMFQVMLALHSDVAADMDLPGLRLESAGVSNETTHFDLGLHLWRRENGLEGYCCFNRELFDAGTVEGMLQQLEALLRAAVAHPDERVHALPLRPEPEIEAWESRPEEPLPLGVEPRVQNIGGPLPWEAGRKKLFSIEGVEAPRQVGAKRTHTGGTQPMSNTAGVDGSAPECAICFDQPPQSNNAGQGEAVLHCAPHQLEALPNMGEHGAVVVSGGPPAAGPTLRSPAWYLYAPPEADGVHGVAQYRPGEAPRLRTWGVCIRDDEGERRVPVGVVGTLHVDGRPTSDRGRWRADGSLEIVGLSPGIGWRRGARVELGELEARIQAARGVHAARVIQRGPWLVAGVTPSSEGVTREEIQRQVPEVEVVLVDRPPADERALKRLPILDAELASAWERQLGEEARVAIRPAPRHSGRVHVDALRPAWWSSPGFKEEATSPVVGVAPADEGDLAYVRGEDLELPGDAALTLAGALRRHAEAEQGLTLIEADGVRSHLSYARLWSRARRVAGGLARAGLKAGDRVIIHTDALDPFFGAFWGCILGGVVPAVVSAAPSYEQRNGGLDKLWSAWEVLGRPAIISTDSLQAPLREARRLYGEGPLELLRIAELEAGSPGQVHQASPDDVLFFQLSSGSTGAPKCVQLTNRGVVTHIHSLCQHNGYGPDNVTLNWVPLDHVMSLLTAHLRDSYLGAVQVQVSPEYMLGDPLRWFDLVEEFHINQTGGPNFMYKLANEALAGATGRTWDLSSVRLFLNGGEQCTLPVVKEFLERTAPFGVRPRAMQPAFGTAESCTGVTYARSFTPDRAGVRVAKSSLVGTLRQAEPGEESVFFMDLGPAVPGIELRVVDDKNALLPEFVIGHLQLRGDVVFPGYLDNDDANRESFVGDGWYDTGDLGFLRGGRLYITGRAKETIIVRGVNYYCYEIEEAVSSIPGVEPTFVAVSVVQSGEEEQLALFFVPRKPGIDPPLLRAVRDRVSGDFGLAPRIVLPLPRDEFPKTTSGKIQRGKLRRGLSSGRLDELRRQVDLALANERTVPRWSFQRRWVSRDLEPGPEVGGTVLGDGDMAHALRQGLPPGEAVVWAGVPAAVDILELLKEIGPRGGRLLVVAGGGDRVAQAPARALLLSAPQEWPGLDTRFVELDVTDEAAARARVQDELRARTREPEVRWVDGQRLVPRLEEAPLDRGEEWLHPGVAVLITGGLGGVGTLLARELLTRLEARVLLVGRRDLETDGEEQGDQLGRVAGTVERRYALSQLEALPGEVLYRAADVTDAARMEEVIAEATTRWGALDGAIHLAGAFPSRLLAEEDGQTIEAVMAPKLQGARALHDLLPPDAFLLGFGSVYGVFGGYAGGAYAAACASLEAFMAWRRTNGRARAACLSWSNWDDIGLSRDFAFREQSVERGFRMITARRGLASLFAAMSGPGRDLVIGLDPARAHVRRFLDGKPELVERLVAYHTAGSGPMGSALKDRLGRPAPCDTVQVDALPIGPDGRLDMSRLQDAASSSGATREPVLPRTGLERTIAGIWKKVLKVDEIDIDRTFFEQGGQSVLLIQVITRLEAVADRRIPVVELFRYPTVRQLARHLSEAKQREPRFNKAAERAAKQRKARRRPPRPRRRR